MPIPLGCERRPGRLAGLAVACALGAGITGAALVLAAWSGMPAGGVLAEVAAAAERSRREDAERAASDLAERLRAMEQALHEAQARAAAGDAIRSELATLRGLPPQISLEQRRRVYVLKSAAAWVRVCAGTAGAVYLEDREQCDVGREWCVTSGAQRLHVALDVVDADGARLRPTILFVQGHTTLRFERSQ